jgi:hypothetical protein
MRAWEEKGRELLAELADLLRAGKFPPQVMDAFDAVVVHARAAFTGRIDGSGEITVPLELFMQLVPTPDGIGIGPPED